VDWFLATLAILLVTGGTVFASWVAWSTLRRSRA
jgi:hypothetical protein